MHLDIFQASGEVFFLERFAINNLISIFDKKTFCLETLKVILDSGLDNEGSFHWDEGDSVQAVQR